MNETTEIAALSLLAGEPGYDPIEERLRASVRTTIEAMFEEELAEFIGRCRYGRGGAALKLLLLVLNRSEKQWKMPPREWAMAKAQFAVLFGERFTRAMA